MVMREAKRSEAFEDLPMLDLLWLVESRSDCPDKARELDVSSARKTIWCLEVNIPEPGPLCDS
jgi:hypothetical protein